MHRSIVANTAEQPLVVCAVAEAPVAVPKHSAAPPSQGFVQRGANVQEIRPAQSALDPGPPARPVQVSAWALSGRKRAFDLLVALILLFPLMAVMLVVSLVSAVVFRARPLFVQERVGLGGKPFKVVKVRSLPTSWRADEGKHELQQRQMPKVSNLIRGTHLDEVPQVINVLLGQMSFVGPRPMITGVLALLPSEIARARAQVRPGITGAWQISTMGGAPLHECPGPDIAYVEHASARGDIWLIWHTVAAHLWGEGLEPNAVALRLAGMDGVSSDVR